MKKLKNVCFLLAAAATVLAVKPNAAHAEGVYGYKCPPIGSGFTADTSANEHCSNIGGVAGNGWSIYESLGATSVYVCTQTGATPASFCNTSHSVLIGWTETSVGHGSCTDRHTQAGDTYTYVEDTRSTCREWNR